MLGQSAGIQIVLAAVAAIVLTFVAEGARQSAEDAKNGRPKKFYWLVTVSASSWLAAIASIGYMVKLFFS